MPMMVSGAILHSVPSGYRFDLSSRTVLPIVREAQGRSAVAVEKGKAALKSMARRVAAEGADGFAAEGRRRPQPEREASE